MSLDLPPEEGAPVYPVEAAPYGELSGLLVDERCTRFGVRYCLVSHKPTGAILLNTTPSALHRALTALEGVDWTRTPPMGSAGYDAADQAIRRACLVEGVSRG